MKVSWLKPNWECGEIITKISHKELLNKGIKGLMLDVDGTLIAGNQTKIDKTVMEWIIETKKHIDLYLVSNNPSRERIETIANQLNLKYTYRALKPRRGSILKAIDNLGIEKSSIGIIGDRVFTDILGGNRLGIYTVLVKPMGEGGKASQNIRLQKYELILSKLIQRLI